MAYAACCTKQNSSVWVALANRGGELSFAFVHAYLLSSAVSSHPPQTPPSMSLALPTRGTCSSSTWRRLYLRPLSHAPLLLLQSFSSPLLGFPFRSLGQQACSGGHGVHGARLRRAYVGSQGYWLVIQGAERPPWTSLITRHRIWTLCKPINQSINILAEKTNPCSLVACAFVSRLCVYIAASICREILHTCFSR